MVTLFIKTNIFIIFILKKKKRNITMFNGERLYSITRGNMGLFSLFYLLRISRPVTISKRDILNVPSFGFNIINHTGNLFWSNNLAYEGKWLP